MFCIQVPISDTVLTNVVPQISGEFGRHIHALIQSTGRLPFPIAAGFNNGEPKTGQREEGRKFIIECIVF